MINKTLRPKYDVDRLYVFRKEGGRGQGSIQALVHWYKDLKIIEKALKKTDYSHQK